MQQPIKDYKFFKADSSFIKAVIWNINTETLAVIFSSGSIWVYYNVPENVYEELASAESTGKYFNTTIRDVYQSEKVNDKLKKTQTADG